MAVPLLGIIATASPDAYCQSGVNLYGVIDTAFTRIQGQGHRAGLSQGNNSPSRLGFRGTEDLGGGLSAGFVLEADITGDDGNAAGLMFRRRSTVSLLGRLGEVRLGRDYTPVFWSSVQYDPFNARGIGGLMSFGTFYNNVSVDNAVSYLTPATLGGVFAQVQRSFGEANSRALNDKQADALTGRVGYIKGPVNIAASYGEWKQVIGASNTAPTAIGRDFRAGNITGSYNLGYIKPTIFLGQERVQDGSTTGARLDSLMVGFTAPLGIGVLRASLARYDLKNSANDFDKLAVGYGYYLSRRTQVYGTVATVRNRGGSARTLNAAGLPGTGVTASGHSNGVEFGLQHLF